MTAKVFLKIILCFAYLKEHAEDTTVKLRAAYQEEYVIGDRSIRLQGNVKNNKYAL